jgi:tetratricopeptide (TPR) repeat protein
MPFYPIIETWLDGLPLVDGELALGGKSVVAAPDAAVRRFKSIVVERHIAAYWLEGHHRAYSCVRAHTMLFSRALACSRTCDPDVAIRTYTRILKSEAKSPVVLSARGWAYVRKGQLAEALADLGRALETSPQASTYLSRAWAFFHSGKLDEAEKDAREALRLEPKSAWPSVVLFRVEVALGRRAEMAKQARQFLSLRPADAEGRRVQLLLRYFLGEVPLTTLRTHPYWADFEVAVRGYTGGGLHDRRPKNSGGQK